MTTGSVRTTCCRNVDNISNYVEEEDVEDFNDPPPVVLWAMLTKCPQSVYDLWKVYEFVFSGCEPANGWTRAERVNDHFKYYEEYFWVRVLQMIKAGHRGCGKIIISDTR